MSNLMTQAEYARYRNVSKQAISDLIKRGIITLIAGKIDPEYADMQCARMLNPAKSKSLQQAEAPSDAPRSKVTEISDYQRHRAERERIEMETAQLDLDERRGELIDRTGVLRGLTEAGHALRDQLMGLPRRLAPELAGCGDPQKAERDLEAEMRAVCDQFAKTLIARLENTGAAPMPEARNG